MCMVKRGYNGFTTSRQSNRKRSASFAFYGLRHERLMCMFDEKHAVVLHCCTWLGEVNNNFFGRVRGCDVA